MQRDIIMNNPLVLLVSRSASRTQAYREALECSGLSCMAITTLNNFTNLVSGIKFNGILLDMPVMNKASANDRIALEDVLKAMPSAYLNIAPASDVIKLTIATGTQGNARSFEEFSSLCTNFPARLICPKLRYPLYLQASLSNCPVSVFEEHTVTLNVSSKGCFIFSANAEFNIDQRIFVRFISLEDTAPMSAAVCWHRQWGSNGNLIPGIGIRFDNPSESQLNQIKSLLEPLKSC